MNQLPLFLNIYGRKVILVGKGDAADAKRRLIERAGGICVDADNNEARLAFVAMEGNEAVEVAAMLKTRGLLVNVVDQPDLCDFTTPSIVDRTPVLVAVGTGGASAGLAKTLRQRIETLLPQSLGELAQSIAGARDAIRKRWPEADDRRRALDAALSGPLDPLRDQEDDAVQHWLNGTAQSNVCGLVEIMLVSTDPDDLTLRHARLLGEADHIFHDSSVPDAILNRARADAVRHSVAPPDKIPPGLVLYLRLRS